MKKTDRRLKIIELEELITLFQDLRAEQETPPALRERLAGVKEVIQPPASRITYSLPSAFLRRLAEACPGLRSLNLFNTDLNELSPLAGLTELQRLYLSNTQVQELSPLAGLTELRELSLGNTQIRDLSPLVGLAELQRLYLSNTQVRGLSALAGLTELQRLCLDNTQVRDLSPLAGLRKLQRLDLSSTQVSDLSPLAGLTELRVLFLSNTQVSDLSPLAGLTDLQELFLPNTQVRDLSPLAGLTELRELHLNNTQVRDLSPLEGLTALEELSLAKLSLDALPRFCLRDGLDLRLNGTRFSRQPEALFRLPRAEVLRTYYDQPLEKINEGKVIFLGESGVGKTHTVRRILDQGAQKPYDTQSTPGVDIQPYDCGNGMWIRFWDFGGQEIMQSMHRCFLTERSCYVVVVSNRDPDQAMPQARKWLRTIAGFSDRVSVLLAVNQWHNVAEQRNVDAEELRSICPMLKEIVFYSAADDSREDFRRRIIEPIRREAALLDSIQLELPESWAAIRRKLLGLRENYITLAQYQNICARHGLGGKDENTEAIRMWLLDWFNDMGVCFSYHKNAPKDARLLRDYKVLQPKWLTNGIYRIIDNGHNRSASGVLDRDDLSALLNSEEYKAVDPGIHYNAEADQRYILEVMRKFDRSYPIDETHEFIPETLPGRRPERPEPRGFGTPLVYTLELAYLPISLLHRLMIAMRDWIVGVPWRSGVLLQDERDALLLDAYPETGRLRLSLYRRESPTLPFCALFHEARTRLLRSCREMRLVVKEERLCLSRGEAAAEYALSALVSRYYRQGDLDYPLPATRGDADFTLGELLLPVFDRCSLNVARHLTAHRSSDALEALNVVCAVYPYATKETLARLPEQTRRSLTKEELDIFKGMLDRRRYRSTAEFDAADRLWVLSLLWSADPEFPDWLEANGKKTESIARRTNPMLEQKRITGVNRDLFVWAEDSKLYRRALGGADPEQKLLAAALGPNENDRCVATAALMKAIWEGHPELGLAPDYRLLTEKEHNRDYYPKYRDHSTHMFKVFLLGLYLYERHRALREAVDAFFRNEPKPEEAFLSVWTLTALYHDMGYLIETEQGARDSEEASFVYARLSDALSLPMTHLFPGCFGTGTEAGLQKQYRSSRRLIPAAVETLTDLEQKLALLKGLGPSVRLCADPERNPLQAYYEYLSRRRGGRSYYDHGVVSACMLLFVRDALCQYLEECPPEALYREQAEALRGFLAQEPEYRRFTELAARAVALHNVKKDFNETEALELNQAGVTIGEFRIPLAQEPIAYLLRLCDELQCWDRRRYDAPERFTLSGDKLCFNADAGRLSLSVFDSEVRGKLQAALEGLLEPPVKECVELV